MKSYVASLLLLAGLGNALDYTVTSLKEVLMDSTPYSYGMMFEDISRSGDGGIYAELIMNRAFQGSPQYPINIKPWTAVNNATIDLKNLTDPLRPHFPSSLNVAASGTDKVGFANPGFYGIDVDTKKYTGSFWVKGNYEGKYTASLIRADGSKVLASSDITATPGDGWVNYSFTLTPEAAAPDADNLFQITFDSAGAKDGSLDFNLISLFPPTWKDRPNGMRPDLMEIMSGLKPKFFRIPGGNNLEGDDLNTEWKWKNTIGPIVDRPGRPGTWGYQNTDGLGVIEYLEMCEDLNVEPVWAVWAGFYLGNPIITEADLKPFVDDALAQIEFIVGDETTEGGKLRASVGRKDPFKVKYIEVGNEDHLGGGLDSYKQYRFKAFHDAIVAKYPDMVVMASTVEIDLPEKAYGDYHIYGYPQQLVDDYYFFDKLYPLNGTNKFMVGEYATQYASNGTGKGDILDYPYWEGSVAEAVYSIGIERNGKTLFGMAYAPLLNHMNQTNWTPNMVAFNADPKRTVISTSYHVLQALSESQIESITKLQDYPPTNPVFFMVGYNKNKTGIILKGAIYGATEDVNFTFEQKETDLPFANATLHMLTADQGAKNLPFGPEVVKTDVSILKPVEAGTMKFNFKAPNLSVFYLQIDLGSGAA